MASGFDNIAAWCVVRAKEHYPGIEFVAVIPYKGHEKDYHDLLQHADDRVFISPYYFDGVFLRRNDYLLDNSSLLVCFHTGVRGGTQYTFNSAHRLGYEIINIAE